MGITPPPMTDRWTTHCHNSLKNSIHHTSKGNLGWVSHLLTCSFFVLLLSSSLPNTESPHCNSPGGRSLDSHPTPPQRGHAWLWECTYVYMEVTTTTTAIGTVAQCQAKQSVSHESWCKEQEAWPQDVHNPDGHWSTVLPKKYQKKSLSASLLSTVFEFLNNEHSVFV